MIVSINMLITFHRKGHTGKVLFKTKGHTDNASDDRGCSLAEFGQVELKNWGQYVMLAGRLLNAST